MKAPGPVMRSLGTPGGEGSTWKTEQGNREEFSKIKIFLAERQTVTWASYNSCQSLSFKCLVLSARHILPLKVNSTISGLVTLYVLLQIEKDLGEKEFPNLELQGLKLSYTLSFNSWAHLNFVLTIRLKMHRTVLSSFKKMLLTFTIS